MQNELKPCPFCGGEAEIHIQPVCGEKGVCVRCKKCKSRSKFDYFDCTYQYYHGEENVFISKERATKDIVKLWNRRANDEQR